MARLPQPGGDNGNWGTILNTFLKVSHDTDGTLKPIDQSNITNLTDDLAAINNDITDVQADVATLQSDVNDTQTDLSAKANDSDVVHDTGAETIAGVKTFSSIPVVPDGSFSAAKLSFDPATQAELDAHVNDTSAAHAASAISFTPAGTITATDVQAAVSEASTDAASALSTHAGDLSLHSSGRELAYASSAAAQTGITTATDLTGLTITFTVGSRPVDVIAFAPWVTSTLASTTAGLIISAADGVSIVVNGVTIMMNVGLATLQVVERITTPGVYTRKARLIRASGTGTLGNNSGLSTTVSYIQAIER